MSRFFRIDRGKMLHRCHAAENSIGCDYGIDQFVLPQVQRNCEMK